MNYVQKLRLQVPLLLSAWLLASAPATPAAAQDAAQLRLGDVYAAIAAQHPMLEAARDEAIAGRERIGPARRWPDPQIQLGLMNRELWTFELSDPLGMNTVRLMQMVPFPGKSSRAGHLAEARAAVTAEKVSEVTWELRSRGAMAFYDLFRADRELDIMISTRHLLQDIAKTVESMYGVGDARQVDVLKAQVETARMTQDIVRMQAMREAMVARLNALMGRPLGAPVPSPALPVAPAELPSRDSLEALALAQRPAVKAAALGVRAADASIEVAKRDIWPDLQLGLEYGWRPMTGGGTDQMLSMMFGFSLPIWAGSKQKAMQREAEAMRAASAADLSSLAADTRGRLGELYAEVLRAESLGALYRQTILPQADAAAASALGAYRAGTVDFMTLLDSQMSAARYRQELVQLDAEQGKALAELEMLTAAPLLDPNSAIESQGAVR